MKNQVDSVFYKESRTILLVTTEAPSVIAASSLRRGAAQGFCLRAAVFGGCWASRIQVHAIWLKTFEFESWSLGFCIYGDIGMHRDSIETHRVMWDCMGLGCTDLVLGVGGASGVCACLRNRGHPSHLW